VTSLTRLGCFDLLLCYVVKRVVNSFRIKMKIVRDLFLRCLSSVYLFAFASLYVQIPGQILHGMQSHVVTG